MTKYFGLLFFIIGLIFTRYLETKISDNKLIISDYIESEFENVEWKLDYFRVLNNNIKDRDSTAITILQLYEDIKLNGTYSTVEREKIINLLSEFDSNKSNLANIALFNKLCRNLMAKYDKAKDKSNYTLIIDKLEHFKRDSLALSITPILYFKDENGVGVEFYHQSKIIDFDKLHNFKGNLNELEVRITNCNTGEFQTITGE